jgi:ABC-type antimicrobial peptide transport system permease subunit
MRAGRAFTRDDSPRTRAAIVNETLASRLFRGADAIGRQLWSNGTAYEVVGIVADYRSTALQNHERDPKLFLPLDASAAPKQMTFLVRASGDPAAVERTLRRTIEASVAGHVVAQSVTLAQIIDVAGQEILVGTAPLVPLISTGMLLTAAGIYGVLAFAIARRSRELAVRIAIGATRRNILQLVASHSVRLVVLGSASGVGATFALSRVVRAVDAEGSFMADPGWMAFAAPFLVIGAIGIVATWVPSRRAMKIDPAQLLRST